LVLLLASHVFVTFFGKIVRWEAGGPSLRLGEFCQFDCGWYATIIRDGYDAQPHVGPRADAANWPFFPLFPLLARPLHKLLHLEPGLAAVIASKIALFAAIFCFLLLVRHFCSSLGDCMLAGTLVAFNPCVVYAHGGYAEPLYFALVAIAFYFLQREQWTTSGAAGALLSATRLVGVSFLLSYLMRVLRRFSVARMWKERRLELLLGVLLCPVGLSLHMLYMYYRTGDALAFVHIYIAWGVARTNPLTILMEGFHAGHWQRIWAWTAVGGWGVSLWLIKEREYEQALFLAVSILIPTMAEVAGMPRHVWWQPPMLYAIYFFLKKYSVLQPLYLVSSAGMAAVMTYLWISGSPAVV
jgi:hypothetical protein